MPDFGFNSGLPQTPAGLPDKDFGLVLPLYQALNNLAQRISDLAGVTTYNQLELANRSQVANLKSQTHDVVYALAPTALDYGKLVHLYLDSGKLAAEEADATNDTKPANGIVDAPFGIAAGEYGKIVLTSGFTAGISGTTVGQTYYLSTAGNASTTRPSAAGSIIQAVGTGLGSAGFYLHISSLFIKN